RSDPGFQADRILASVVLPAPERYRDPRERALFYKRILDAVRVLPGVENAGTVDALPFSGENHGGYVSSTEGSKIESEIDIVGGEYLQTMGVRLLEGRWFREEEMAESSDTAMVNDFVAARLWPGVSAIGQRVCIDCTPENPNHWKRLIGVVSSASHAALNETAKGNIYLAAGAMRASYFVVVRTEQPAGDLEKAIRRTIAAIDPNQPVFLSASMTALIADSVADRRFIALLLAVTAGVGLIMSAAGIYGVISYTTSRRTQEIGIRIAVGAMPRDVLALVFRQGFLTVAAGLGIGLGIALLAMHFLSSVFPGLELGNLTNIWIATAVVALTAGIACWLPARRATTIDPMSALRQE
ncbi:MAG TPA: FtsX-like permease family protein, partial [Bryobacteraceae bacterium]